MDSSPLRGPRTRSRAGAVRRPFLTARWERLLLLNYPCDAALLRPLVPAGTTLDTWEGSSWVSLVGFLFLDTRLRGLPIPWHRDFEEVNLRFYVRRTVNGEVRRGVVFVKELVPRRAIAWVARHLYNEPYEAVSMTHRVERVAGGESLSYGWQYRGERYAMEARTDGRPAPSPPGSAVEFITEHYWGYTAQPDGGTIEYRVDHPRWRVWDARAVRLSGAWTALYGPELGGVLSRRPATAFVAEGSAVQVFRGRRI